MKKLNEKQHSLLSEYCIGMLGYGAQGSAEAANLRKSEIKFSLGVRESGTSFQKAKKDGFEPQSISKTVSNSDILFLNLPDQIQAEVYQKHIKASEVKYLVFAHGFNTHFKLIPVESDGPQHILIAPKGAASGLEKLYGTADALPAVLAFQSSTQEKPKQKEVELIETLAKALGAHPHGLIWAEFKDETVCDLFSEQALLCGGVSSLLRRSYEVLTEAGYNKETAYFETLFELKLIVDLIWKDGISGMRSKISPTARYGDISRGDRIFDDQIKKKMQSVLKEVESGEFAKEFLNKIDSKEFQELENSQAQHPIEKIGAQLRQQRSLDGLPTHITD